MNAMPLILFTSTKESVMQTKINRFNTYKKLCQVILASAILCNVSAYAAPAVETEEQTINTNTVGDEHKEGMAFREVEPAIKGSNATEAPTYKKPTVLFVCGGNTGRSFMAEWYTRAKYGKDIITFSRGSGILPGDQVMPEEPAANLVVSKHNATLKQVSLHRATPATITDIYNADIVLTMTPGHKDRLDQMITRECTPSNIDSRFGPDNPGNPNLSDRNKWVDKMCTDGAQQTLRNKIHTLIGCATGTDGLIADGYDKPASAYPPIRDAIMENIKTIMTNTISQQKPSSGMLGMSYHPNPYANIHCIK